MLDFRIQYALHTTSFEEQPLSDKTLSCFRKRCYDYETLHSKDFYHDCVKDLSASIAKLAVYVNKINDSALPDDFKHYIDHDDFNRVIYNQSLSSSLSWTASK